MVTFQWKLQPKKKKKKLKPNKGEKCHKDLRREVTKIFRPWGTKYVYSCESLFHLFNQLKEKCELSFNNP